MLRSRAFFLLGMMEQRKVTARELDDILGGERTQPMVVDFYATWCGPCILLAQELETVCECPFHSCDCTC